MSTVLAKNKIGVNIKKKSATEERSKCSGKHVSFNYEVDTYAFRNDLNALKQKVKVRSGGLFFFFV